MSLADVSPTQTAITEKIAPLGTISIRVVVLPHKNEDHLDTSEPTIVPGDDDIDIDDGPTPIGSYLERPKGGKLSIVFLVNGQRQDALDATFIAKNLGFKYIRKRTVIIIDVDELDWDALNDMMQGSRQGFYKGDAWSAVRSRLIVTLKNDLDLKRFEEEAEAQISELQAGDERVKEALNTLIDAHHESGDHLAAGASNTVGESSGESFGSKNLANKPVVELANPEKGAPAQLPVIRLRPAYRTLRLEPVEKRELSLEIDPPTAWASRTDLTYRLDPPSPELNVTENRHKDRVTHTVQRAQELDPSEYPLRTELHVFAKFKGTDEVRHVALGIVVKPLVEKPVPELLDEPTYLRTVTRQPVRFLIDKADTHVRLRWDGKDTLVSTGQWSFALRCLTSGYERTRAVFSEPTQGLFSVAVSTPIAKEGDSLEFEVRGVGPDGRSLLAKFFRRRHQTDPRT